ncbi:SIMPL domain-containing protein [soil metagenome]
MTEQENHPGSRQIGLPLRVSVSLRAGVVLAIANVLCAGIVAYAWTRTHRETKAIAVTGSARKAIQSDLIVWNAKITAIDADLTKAYDTLNASTKRAIDFVKAQGIPAEQIMVSSVNTWKRRGRDEKGNETEKIVSYELWQQVEISSGDVVRVADVARRVTELIKEGIVIESTAPSYIYTRLADLKIAMLAEATKDATTRAQQIAGNSGSKLGSILDARMGVMQINPAHSYEASDSGRNDTSSFEKEITAVVSARFSLE